MSQLKEECGVFGIFNNKDAAALTALGLHSLQHRGQEGCGIVTFDGTSFCAERRLGLVGDNFTKGKILQNLPGSSAIGHNRYSTSGNNLIKNIQPFLLIYILEVLEYLTMEILVTHFILEKN